MTGDRKEVVAFRKTVKEMLVTERISIVALYLWINL